MRLLPRSRNPSKLRTLEAAVANGSLKRESITTPAELAMFVELSQIPGSGESACLALASSRGWLVACDEKNLFLREAHSRLGDGRILNTSGLYVLWVRSGLISVEEADAAKATLEANRFKSRLLIVSRSHMKMPRNPPTRVPRQL